MSQDPNTIDQVESFITGTIEIPLNASFGLEAELSPDWLPDEYTITNDRIVLDGADYDLSILLDGKVASDETDARRLYNTYTETKCSSLDHGWLSVADEYFTNCSVDVPTDPNVVMGYTIGVSKDLKAIWPEDQEELDNTTIELYKDDVLVDANKYIVNTEGLWWVSETYDDLPVNVYETDFDLKLSITKTATESDLDENNLLDSDIPTVDTNLEDLVVGTDDLELDVLNTGADSCGAVPRSFILDQYQVSDIVLYALDRNGQKLDLGATEFVGHVSIRDAMGGSALITVPCDKTVGENEFTVEFMIETAGIYLVQLLLYDTDEEDLLFTTTYYMAVNPTAGEL